RSRDRRRDRAKPSPPRQPDRRPLNLSLACARGYSSRAVRPQRPRMGSLQNHLRKTFLAGIFAAVPVAVTLFICWYIDSKTRIISEYLFGRPIPVVGIVIALAAIYACGLVATTLLGKWLLKVLDRLLVRV